MKNIKLNTIFLLLCLSFFNSCQKDMDITTEQTLLPESVLVVDMEIKGTVVVPNLRYWIRRPYAYNATVSLVYDGVTIDETNTDGFGKFSFPLQPVPLEGAEVQVTATDYYPNVKKITEADSIVTIQLLPTDAYDFPVEAIITTAPKIDISGVFQQSITSNSLPTLYVVNSADELVGNFQVDNPDLSMFKFTTLANEELFLHFTLPCESSTAGIPIGPFSVDTDLGVLMDATMDFNEEFARFKGYLTDCDGTPYSSYLMAKVGERTNPFHFIGSNGYYSNSLLECESIGNEILVTAVNPARDSFGTATVNYVPGVDAIIDVAVCQINDTYFNYSIAGGADIITESFTVGNILQNGKLVLTVDIPTVPYPDRISFDHEISGSEVADHMGTLIQGKGSYNKEIIWASENSNVTITLNDGNYIEGTFTGQVIDPFEVGLGTIEGSFRAIIQ